MQRMCMAELAACGEHGQGTLLSSMHLSAVLQRRPAAVEQLGAARRLGQTW